MKIKYHLLTIIPIILVCLTNCAIFNATNKNKIKIPKVQLSNVPGGNLNNWRYLGTSADNQLIEEINESSISLQSEHLYKYQDRKTVISMAQYSSYVASQPKYKYVISEWQMDCIKQQYLITSSVLYDEDGKEIKQYNYSQDPDIRWIKFGNESLGELQYNYICLNKHRNLGY